MTVKKSTNPHTTADNLVLPDSKAIGTRMLCEKIAKDLNFISLCNATIKNIVVWKNSGVFSGVWVFSIFLFQIRVSNEVFDIFHFLWIWW